jgi:putative membrane protein
MTPRSSRYELGLLLSLVVLLVLSGIHPHDYFTWVLEVFPVLIGVPILIWVYPRFRFTRLVYSLLWLHAIILMVGGHYTYAQVPLGFWMESALGFARNHYDRIGHLTQGFVPAILAREILLRKTPLRSRAWVFFLVTCVCLAVSACYELVEWGTAVATGSAADAFLGTQGNPWDTQWDMLLALIGAVTAQATLSRLHDRQIAALPS